jgi:hypothetical protein
MASGHRLFSSPTLSYTRTLGFHEEGGGVEALIGELAWALPKRHPSLVLGFYSLSLTM